MPSLTFMFLFSYTTEPFVLGNYVTAFHAVVYHPQEPRFIATANSKEGIALWDVRSPRRYGLNNELDGSSSLHGELDPLHTFQEMLYVYYCVVCYTLLQGSS